MVAESLEQSVDTLLKAQASAPLAQPTTMFAEPAQNGFGMPSLGTFLKASNVNIVAITIGVVLSSTVGSYVSKVLPQAGKFATPIAGAALLIALKGGVGRDIAYGVLIGGLANLLGGYVGGALGGSAMSEPGFAETRVTQGGTDGVTVTSPTRRVFQ